MNTIEIKEALAMPFAPEDLEWRLQQSYEDSMRGLAVPYVTNRAIQDRLDDVVGPDRWRNEYKPWHHYTVKVRSKDSRGYEDRQVDSQLCGISIYFEGPGWITKWDGADNSDIEPVKGGLSDSMKRAAVQWGIGRVLYKMDTVWVDVEKKGRNYVIKPSERVKLDRAYTDLLKKLKLAPAPAGGMQSMLIPREIEEAKGQQDAATPRQSNDPPARQDTQPGPRPLPRMEKPSVEFTVQDVKIMDGMNGVSTSLALVQADGKKALGFVRGPHPELKSGVKLFNVRKTQKQQDSVVFYLLDSFDYDDTEAA